MKMPVFGPVVVYGRVATITRTFSSLLNHGVFITDSMEILSNLTNNEIYKEILSRTLIGLSKGAKLSETFKGEWAFPVVAYEMLVTGESTGQLALMMQKVAEHFENLQHNSTTALKSLLEPMVIILLAVSVGFILISIMVPMFDMYGQI
jgi:type IV pilus assembly protein PilC